MKTPLLHLKNHMKIKGVALFLFLSVFLIHAIPVLFSDVPVFLDEYINISVSAKIYGLNWQGISTFNSATSLLSGLIYVPLFYIFTDSVALYKAILIVNSAILASIAPLSFYAAQLLGVTSKRKSMLIGFSTSLLFTIVVGKSFASVGVLMTFVLWIVLWLSIKRINLIDKKPSFFHSILIGGLITLNTLSFWHGFFISIAYLVLLLLWKIFKKTSFVRIIPFGVSFVVFTVINFYLEIILINLKNNLPTYSLTSEAMSLWVSSLTDGMNSSELFAELYFIMILTCGMGIFALGMACLVIYRIAKKRENTFVVQGAAAFDDKTLFISLYTFLTTFFACIAGCMVSMSATDLMLSVGMVVPILVFISLVFLFRHGITLRRAIATTVFAFLVVLAFHLISKQDFAQIINGSYNITAGENLIDVLYEKGSLPASSVILTIFILVCTICTAGKKNKAHYVLNGFLVVQLLCWSWGNFFYVPQRISDGLTGLSKMQAVTPLLFNESASPKVTTYGLSEIDIAFLQYMNRKTTITLYEDKAEIPLETIVVLPKEEDTDALKLGRLVRISETEDFTIYAYGQQAVTYVVSKNIIEEWEANESTTSQ